MLLFINIMVSLGFEMLSLYMPFQVVNRLHKDYVHDTVLKYGEQYDKIWIYDKIHHEINQFCNSHSLQQVYIDVFNKVCMLKVLKKKKKSMYTKENIPFGKYFGSF